LSEGPSVMSSLHVCLFGELEVRMSGSELTDSLSGKAQELLAYLLIHRRSHPREKLATLLWQHGSSQRTKAYLRKALWQLRDALESETENAPSVVRADDGWIQINPEAPLWADVVAFEAVFDAVRDCPASEMPSKDLRALQEAETLYSGDLLENWYEEWCLMERERLRDMFLRMLGRLARCCEHNGAYDTGIQYGLRLLRMDPDQERGHRQLMRLRARAGNRVAALRQYERCAEVLDRELGSRRPPPRADSVIRSKPIRFRTPMGARPGPRQPGHYDRTRAGGGRPFQVRKRDIGARGVVSSGRIDASPRTAVDPGRRPEAPPTEGQSRGVRPG